MTEDDLATLVAEARHKFESLSPEDQKRHRDEQRRSFVRHPLIILDEATDISPAEWERWRSPAKKTGA